MWNCGQEQLPFSKEWGKEKKKEGSQRVDTFNTKLEEEIHVIREETACEPDPRRALSRL